MFFLATRSLRVTVNARLIFVGWDSVGAVTGTFEIRHVLAGVLQFCWIRGIFTRILSIDPRSLD
jgi:hypothetical protein